MNLSIKNTLLLCIFFFTCSFLYGAETGDEDSYPIKYCFYEKEDCIKIKITLPKGEKARGTVCKIKNPDSKGVAARMQFDRLKCLDDRFQLVDIEMYAVSSQEDGDVTLVAIENIEKKWPGSEIPKEKTKKATKYILKVRKQVDFKDDVIPKFTYSKNSPNICYLRFFTNP